ncbi:MAG: hypothetical protein UR94_C0016G0023 [Parcubacteria group bacterium GW2011_GWA2_36_10]|nr:MAG: hypothetical protein UR94_C0016G0023 [Parcubacteria group bacterium GW2011_GWA2_36_10]
MYKKLDQVLALVTKTGDKMIVVSENHDPYVVMSLKDYERLLTNNVAVHDLSEDELLSKINRDIAIWKSVQASNDYNLDQFKIDEQTVASGQVKSLALEKKPESIENLEPGLQQEEEKYYLEPVSDN